MAGKRGPSGSFTKDVGRTLNFSFTFGAGAL
jgi:hypothetical protein